MTILVTEAELDPQAAWRQVRADHYGAVVLFLGVVRNHSEGRAVTALEYEAYKEMAERTLHQIAAEVRERWGLGDVVMIHRLGRLAVGEISLVVAIGAPHRKEAFAAGQYAVDRLKEIVPIWKKEFGAFGEAWVEGQKVAP